jgi:hypothetical protein
MSNSSATTTVMGVVCIYKNFVDANSVIESLKKRVKTLKIRASENTVDDPGI